MTSGDGLGNWDSVDARCECGHAFRVPRSLAGGMTNCPACGQATSVEAGADWLFRLLVGLGVLVVLATTTVAYMVAGPVAGAVVFLLGAAIVGISVLFS